MMVIGTRPQIIKATPIVEECEKHSDIEVHLVHTGQHYDYEMSKAFFDELDLPDPLINLNVGSGTHARQTAQMMIKLEKVIDNLLPHLVVVFGDCNSTLAGALTATKMGVPVAHVEAGCRTHEAIPEEANRRLTDHSSTLLLASSRRCVENLKAEGLKSVFTGDVMYDSLLKHLPRIKEKSPFEKSKPYILLTLHRPENVDNLENLRTVLMALEPFDLNVIFSVHPRTKKRLGKLSPTKLPPQIRYFSPLTYRRLLSTVLNAVLVVTDSGGLTKEAFWLEKPCVTIRDRTEWFETVEAGCNLLVPKTKRGILDGIQKMLRFKFPEKVPRLFGDGNASQKVVEEIQNWARCL